MEVYESSQLSWSNSEVFGRSCSLQSKISANDLATLEPSWILTWTSQAAWTNRNPLLYAVTSRLGCPPRVPQLVARLVENPFFVRPSLLIAYQSDVSKRSCSYSPRSLGRAQVSAILHLFRPLFRDGEVASLFIAFQGPVVLIFGLVAGSFLLLVLDVHPQTLDFFYRRAMFPALRSSLSCAREIIDLLLQPTTLGSTSELIGRPSWVGSVHGFPNDCSKIYNVRPVIVIPEVLSSNPSKYQEVLRVNCTGRSLRAYRRCC